MRKIPNRRLVPSFWIPDELYNDLALLKDLTGRSRNDLLIEAITLLKTHLKAILDEYQVTNASIAKVELSPNLVNPRKPEGNPDDILYFLELSRKE